MLILKDADFQTMLRKHEQWVRGEDGGERLRLEDIDLREVNFKDLTLREVFLVNCNMRGVALDYTDLSGSTLTKCDLEGAHLSHAHLRQVDLERVNLQNAILRYADFLSAYLSGTDIRGANLQGANLRGADLEAVVEDEHTKWPFYNLCPEEGAFIAYKALRNGVLATLEIPTDAQRTSSRVGRKCRASKAKLIKVEFKNGTEITTFIRLRSLHNSSFEYQLGEMAVPDQYDPNPNVECTKGIHFFISKEEARNYEG